MKEPPAKFATWREFPSRSIAEVEDALAACLRCG